MAPHVDLQLCLDQTYVDQVLPIRLPRMPPIVKNLRASIESIRRR